MKTKKEDLTKEISQKSNNNSNGNATSKKYQESESEIKIDEKDPLLTPEIEENTKIFYEYFDINFAKSLAKNLLTPLEKYYFRAEFIGFVGDEFPERNDEKRPLIFASNHSGMAFPWDAIIFASGLARRNGYDFRKAVRGLSSPMLSKSKLMNPFLLNNFWKRAGGIDATTLNFDTIMHYGDTNILIYPEGIDGIGKGFDKRYQLQRMSTSALRMSLKYKTDIIPFATINAEYVNPFSYSIDTLNNLVRQIGIPFIPIGFTTLLVLFQPWMFYFAFPAKLIYVRGGRIKPYEMINKSFEEINYDDLDYLRNKIHQMMQLELDMAVREYGQEPFDWKDFFDTMWQNMHKIMYFIPLAWPFLFTEHDRRYYELKRKLEQYPEQTIEHQTKRRQMIIEAQEEVEDESLWGMVSNVVTAVVKNPQVLLLYVPVIGLGTILWQGFQGEE
jgi:hypothetical protein